MTRCSLVPDAPNLQLGNVILIFKKKEKQQVFKKLFTFVYLVHSHKNTNWTFKRLTRLFNRSIYSFSDRLTPSLIQWTLSSILMDKNILQMNTQTIWNCNVRSAMSHSVNLAILNKLVKKKNKTFYNFIKQFVSQHFKLKPINMSMENK